MKRAEQYTTVAEVETALDAALRVLQVGTDIGEATRASVEEWVGKLRRRKAELEADE